MNPRSDGREEPLFDLPLRPAAGEPEPRPGAPETEREPAAPHREPESAVAESEGGLLLFDEPEPGPRPIPDEAPPAAPPLSQLRLRAGLFDLAAEAGAGMVLALGSLTLGARLSASDLPGIAVALLLVSYFLEVVPLLFWGQTLGMRRAGLIALTPDGALPSLAQASRRWLAGWLTRLGLGLPALAHLADRMSGTEAQVAGDGAVSSVAA